MKKLLTVVILVLGFFSQSLANDISDFQIDGIGIGDSLLDYFDKNQINSRKKQLYLGDDNFHKINFPSKKGVYELINFHLKKNDNKFVVYSMAGRNIIEFNECLEKKKSLKIKKPYAICKGLIIYNPFINLIKTNKSFIKTMRNIIIN